MSEHFTRNTISAAFWCGKCARETPHRIDSGRKGPRLDCMARSERQLRQKCLAAGIPITQHKEQDSIRVNEATWKYLTGPREEMIVGPFCSCRSFRLPHSVERHRELRADYDWTPWTKRWNP